MRSATWLKYLTVATGIAGLSLFSVACSKSSKEKQTNSSQTKLNGNKGHDKTNANPDPKENLPGAGKETPTHTTKKSPKGGSGYKILANKPEYTLKLVYPASMSKGGSGSARVVLEAKTGWKLNEEYPTKLQIMSPEGTSVAKAKQTRADAVRWAKKSAEWNVQITASASGAKPFTGKFKFAVCTETTCDPKKELLAWVVDVK